MTAPAEGEAAKEAAPESPAAEAATTPKDKRRTSFFGAFGVNKKEKKTDSSDNEATDGEAPKEAKAKSNKLGGLFRKPSKAVKLDKEEVAAAETETKADKAEETVEPVKETAEETAAPTVEEAAKTEEAAATEEAKNVNVPAATPVQAAA